MLRLLYVILVLLVMMSCKTQQVFTSISTEKSENSTNQTNTNQIISYDDGSNLDIGHKDSMVIEFNGDNNTIIFENHNVLNLADGAADTLVLDFSNHTILIKTVDAISKEFSDGLKITLTESHVSGDTTLFEY